MAQSILKHPRAVMSELRQEYEIADEAEILAFLERHPEVVPLLLETRDAIRRYFGEDAVRLTMSFDYEWPEEEPKLIAYILAPLGPHEALERLHQFDDDWWLKQTSETKALLLVSLLPIRRV